MSPGGPLKQTIQLAAGQTRDVGTVVFDNIATYSRQSTVRQQAIKDTSDYAATCGLGKAGAESIGLSGGYHYGGYGIDKYEHMAGTVFDESGHRMYFYRLSDKTFWERIHFPRNTRDNASILVKTDDYVPITKTQYDNKKL